MFNTLAISGRKFWNFIKLKTRFGLLSFIILTAVGCGVFLFSATSANAADTSIIWTPLIKLITDLIVWIAGFFVQATIFIMDFVIEIAGYSNFINAKPVLFGWTLMRDLANMFFVVILLIIAFGTVLGVETYSWKKLLVKFVLAAVLVNFSRIICGVIIDAAQVFMMTFLNGVAAVAGGNIINAFKLNKVLSFSTNTSNLSESLGDTAVLGSAIAAGFFAAIAAFTIGAYLIVLLARVVSLWILIILSPLAFVLSIIPKTQSYSGQWWTEFTNNVIAGPILAFFLWLSFAVVGDGLVHDEFATSPFPLNTQSSEIAGDSKVMGGLSEVMEWGNLANFIIAVGLLLAGVKATQKLGVAGAGLLGSAVEMGKRVATVATGVAAGRWLAQKGVEGAKIAGKGVLMNVPLVGGKAWQRRGRDIAGRLSSKVQDIQYAREQVSKKMGKFGEGEVGTKGFFKRLAGKVGAGVFETPLKAEEASKQWGKLAEVKKEVRMEDLGLGTREVGKETLRKKVDLEKLQLQSTAAKERWKADAELKYLDGPQELKDLQTERGGLVARESAEQAIIQEASLEQIKAEEENKKIGQELDNAPASTEIATEALARFNESKAKMAEIATKKEMAEQSLAQIAANKQTIDQKVDSIFKDDKKWNRESLIGRDILQQRLVKEKNLADVAAAQGMMELSYLSTDAGKKAQASAAEAKIFQQQMGETVNAKKQITELKKIEELLKKPQPGQDTTALASRYQSLQQEMYSSKAGGEQLRIDQSRESEKKLALARDEKLKESNQLPRYLTQVLQKHNKEDIDMYSSKTFDQMMANIEFLSGQMAKEQDPAKKSIMQKDLQNWLVGAFSRGSDMGTAALGKASKNKNISVDDVDSIRAAHLSAFLGEEVEQSSDGVDKALEKMKKLQGENYDAFINNYVSGLGVMANGGAVAHGGLYKMVLDKNTGRQTYEATNRESDKDLIRSVREYHLAQARQAGQGFKGALDFKDGKFKLDSDVAVQNTITLVGARTSQGYSNMNKLNLDSLSIALENTDNKQYLENFVKGLKKSITDKRAIATLLQRISQSAFNKILEYVKDEFEAGKKELAKTPND